MGVKNRGVLFLELAERSKNLLISTSLRLVLYVASRRLAIIINPESVALRIAGFLMNVAILDQIF